MFAGRNNTANSPHDHCENYATQLDQASRHALLAALAEVYPNPRSELIFNNPFELICAVVLSAQATDVSVNKVTPALFAAAPNPAALAALGEEGIAPIIKSIGLWRAKARNLAKLGAMLESEYQSVVPCDYAKLIKLPGVGSKTAKVVLNVAFNQPVIAVDTHIFRVCNRTGFCLGKDARQVEDRLPPLVDDEFKLHAHHYLLLHGRYTCKARKPECAQCPIREWCCTFKQQGTDEL